MVRLVVSFSGVPSIAPFGILLQAFRVCTPAGKAKLPIVTGAVEAPSAKLPFQEAAGCKTPFTLKPKVAEESITGSPKEAKRSILKIKITGSTPSVFSINYYKEM